jgi:hypothetical protein
MGGRRRPPPARRAVQALAPIGSPTMALRALLLLLLTAVAGASAAPCDIYTAGGTPCVAAHSMTRALYSAYAGPLYQLLRTPAAGNASRKDIAVRGAGGKADAAAHTTFCRGAICTVERIYDQSPRGNHLGIEQGMPFLKNPRGAHDRAVSFEDPRSKAVLGGQAIYAAYFEGVGNWSKRGRKDWSGQGYSNRTAVGTAVGDEPQSMYAVLSGRTFNGGCCFECAGNSNRCPPAAVICMCYPSPGVAAAYVFCCRCFSYGNAEKTQHYTKSNWTNGSMEAIYFGCGDLGPPQPTCTPADPSGGPYVIADMEHMRGMMATALPPTPITPRDFVVAMVKGEAGHLAISSGDAQRQHSLQTVYDGVRPPGYEVMKKEGGIVLGAPTRVFAECCLLLLLLFPRSLFMHRALKPDHAGVGGDNSPSGAGVFFEGAMTAGFSSNATDAAVLANIVAAGYEKS